MCQFTQDTCTPIVNAPPGNVGAYYLFNHVDLEITYHSGVEEEWGVGFGENGGRIISAKVRLCKCSYNNGVITEPSMCGETRLSTTADGRWTTKWQTVT